MPLRRLINQSMLSLEDANLLESLFNQFLSVNAPDERRAKLASGLVRLFVDGERDQMKLAGFLTDAQPVLKSESPGGVSTFETFDVGS